MIDLPTVILLIEIVALPYVTYKASQEIRDIMGDYVGRFKKHDYKVRTTLLKYMIYENRTETVKLRRIRAYRRISTLSLDPMPTIIEGKNPEQRARVESHYSVPGRSVRTPKNELQILLERDEELKAHNDHPIMISYIVSGSPAEFFREPGILVTQPVGSERLVVKVYFPPDWRYLRHAGNKAKIEVFTLDSNETRHYVPDKQLSVEGDYFDFGDKRGETDWFRVTINRPPQTADVYVEWQWDEETSKKLTNTRTV
jgi:hypothetical protein